jgi:hypothetical protein
MRWIDEEKLLRTLERSVARRFPGPADDVAAKQVVRDVEKYLARRPEFPPLVGSKASAEILEVQMPHITRFREQGRMPQEVPIEQAHPAYIKHEVEEFKKVLDRERAAREKRRRKREKAAAKAAAAEQRVAERLLGKGEGVA